MIEIAHATPLRPDLGGTFSGARDRVLLQEMMGGGAFNLLKNRVSPSGMSNRLKEA
jgi:hypothetical protein